MLNIYGYNMHVFAYKSFLCFTKIWKSWRRDWNASAQAEPYWRRYSFQWKVQITAEQEILRAFSHQNLIVFMFEDYPSGIFFFPFCIDYIYYQMFVSQITVDRQGSKQGNFPILVCLYVGDRVDSSLKDMAIVMK